MDSRSHRAICGASILPNYRNHDHIPASKGEERVFLYALWPAGGSIHDDRDVLLWKQLQEELSLQIAPSLIGIVRVKVR